MSIWLQKSASIQPRTSRLKNAHLVVATTTSCAEQPREQAAGAGAGADLFRRVREARAATHARKFYGAPSRLYRIQILQQNLQFSAFFEIYKISIPLHRSDLKISQKDQPQFCQIENWNFNRNFRFFHEKWYFSSKFRWNFVGISRTCSKNVWIHWKFQKCCKILTKNRWNFRNLWKIESKISIFQSTP